MNQKGRIANLDNPICFVCGHSTWESYFSSKEYPLFTYMRCCNCKFVQLVPIPSEEELNRFYAGLWSETGADSYSDRFLSKAPVDCAALLEWYQPMFSQISSFLPVSQQVRSLLDVGPGAGNILRVSECLGWDAWGIDVSEVAIKNLSQRYGLKVLRGDFCTIHLPEDRIFDIVHMNHVLEHMRDPDLAIQKVKRILKPGGLFYVSVPTVDEKLFDLTHATWKTLYSFSSNWNGFHPYFWWLFSIGHISCYSAGLLKKHLIKHGFKIRWEKSFLPSLHRTQTLLRHIRTVLITPLFILSKSGWQVTIIAQV